MKCSICHMEGSYSNYEYHLMMEHGFVLEKAIKHIDGDDN